MSVGRTFETTIGYAYYIWGFSTVALLLLGHHFYTSMKNSISQQYYSVPDAEAS